MVSGTRTVDISKMRRFRPGKDDVSVENFTGLSVDEISMLSKNLTRRTRVNGVFEIRISKNRGADGESIVVKNDDTKRIIETGKTFREAILQLVSKINSSNLAFTLDLQ